MVKEVNRPWGNFKQFVDNKKCTVKILEIKPRQELSLQYHNKRDEMWYFFDKAIVQLGNRKIRVKPGELVNVPKKKAHRIFAGFRKVKLLEISFGEFKEGDEIILEDKYGRMKSRK